ncbi:putative phospholipid-binding lipoprotein MlaA precursor [mine drainage metagenome]|uniref:Putative phospholipid-binding lipoprotein MlaA n=1 Tax=mine drainage metagenome TaxID=410659 RepID=A0A1J5P9U8_9ZZZZ
MIKIINQGCGRILSRLGVLVAVLLLVACATGPRANVHDPLEPFNRGVYKFNDAVDRAVLRPVSTAYRDVVPSPVRTGVSNFFNNLQDAWSFVNNSLQFKGVAAGNSLVRFSVNTVFGLGGVLDIATEMQIDRSTQDFGETLGHWGVGAGPYLMLPLLGPSTLRDTAAMPIDMQGNAVSHISDVPTRNAATTLNLLNKRARLLDATKMLDQVALDPYTFTRDAFLQRRQNAVYDGNPPDEAMPPAPDDNATQ